MKKNDSGTVNRRLRSSYFTTTVSISLVLFLLGIMGLLLLNAQKLSNYVKENIGFSIIIKDNVKEVRVMQLQKILDASQYVKSTEFITKEKAAKEFIDELGEDFINFIGYNPLLASIEVKLHAPYANPDSIAVIEKDLSAYPEIKEIYYQKSLIEKVHHNIKNLSLIILGFSALMFIISITLINNTIRLSVYSKRFIINTMQLVGATRSFIRKPFLWKGILHGVYGSLVATGMIIGMLYLLQKEFSEIVAFQDLKIIGILFACIVILGIIISYASAFFAVNKYLRMKVDQLYY